MVKHRIFFINSEFRKEVFVILPYRINKGDLIDNELLHDNLSNDERTSEWISFAIRQELFIVEECQITANGDIDIDLAIIKDDI